MRNLVKVKKDLPLELLAPLGCGLQTGAGTVMNSLAVKAGRSIAVFGTGAVGLAAIMAARIVAAAPIVGIDILPKRLRLARELGATHMIDSRKEVVHPHQGHHRQRRRLLRGGDRERRDVPALDGAFESEGSGALLTGEAAPAACPGDARP